MADCGTILVVDHDDANRLSAVQVAVRLGCQVCAVENAQLLLERLDDHDPVLAIVEVELPGHLSGFEVLRELHERFGDGFPVILVSAARTTALDHTTGLMLGADFFRGPSEPARARDPRPPRRRQIPEADRGSAVNQLKDGRNPYSAPAFEARRPQPSRGCGGGVPARTRRGRYVRLPCRQSLVGDRRALPLFPEARAGHLLPADVAKGDENGEYPYVPNRRERSGR